VAGDGIHRALLPQRGGQAHGHAAEELRARGARVDDPAGSEDAERPRHGDLAGAGVDLHLDELGAERVPGVALGLLVLPGLTRGRGAGVRVVPVGADHRPQGHGPGNAGSFYDLLTEKSSLRGFLFCRMPMKLEKRSPVT
jgi:hypothetical protein